jgi:non-specific serine/threonine protein kinase
LSEAGRAALAVLRQALAMPATPSVRLTRRQHQVATLLAAGVSNRGIAVVLGLREGTAKLHVAAVLSRLGAASREEVAPLLDRLASSASTAELIGSDPGEGA